MAGVIDDPSILYPPESAMPVTEEAIAEVFDEIDVVYFMEDGFDGTAYELNKLQDDSFNLSSIGKEMFKLKRQLQVVSKKVSALITKNKDEFCSMTEHYEMIRQEAGGMVERISEIRTNLAKADGEVMNGLKIIANERKREMLADLKSVLISTKTLYETEFRLQELVQEGDFPLAIRLCVEATNAAQEYISFNCIKELSSKFTKILSSMESHIDDALAAMTVVYDQDRYSLVYSAYQMLDNVGGAAAKLLSFFRATLESSARTVLIDRLRKKLSAEETDAMSYEQLCEAVEIDEIIDCIRELGFVLCRCLFVYHEILKFHIDEDERRLCALPVNQVQELDGEEIVEKGIMQKALSDGVYNVFKTASSKFNTLLCCHELSQLNFDNFLDVVEMANRFRKFGRRYFGNSCGEVALTLEKQTCLYFGRYHRERLDELKMFLESEVFTLCPVPANFTLFDLQEFQFLKQSSDAFDEDDSHVHHLIDHVGLGEQLDYILLAPEVDNPFCAPRSEPKKKENEGTGSSSSARSSTSDSDDETYAQVPSQLPVLCNTALNVLRFFGRYIRMTSLLHSVAEEGITAVIQLFDYFVYSIFEFFCKDMASDHFDPNVFTSLQLRKLIEAIRVRLILDNESNEAFKQIQNEKMVPSKLSPCLSLDSIENCFSLAERIIGIESLVFLKRQFEDLRPVLQSLVPHNKQLPVLEKFYQSSLLVIVDIRKSSLGCIASRALDYSKCLKQITSTSFNLNELQDQHSLYVDTIVHELRVFDENLKKVAESVQVSQDLSTLLWSNIIYCISRILVQGYSECNKKCTQEGRALMLLDFEQLAKNLEVLSSMKPIPYRIYVEEYIKAYYLPENCMDDWIAKHPEYSISQVSSLLNSTVAKRAKNKILNVLEGN
ncbi:hypothetical protein FO519_000485 [Halicephalobus sp. NKZ332]|nr:hypothetical protein FO519_000485 [Halicephalobus sp. NKZ332]